MESAFSSNKTTFTTISIHINTTFATTYIFTLTLTLQVHSYITATINIMRRPWKKNKKNNSFFFSFLNNAQAMESAFSSISWNDPMVKARRPPEQATV